MFQPLKQYGLGAVLFLSTSVPLSAEPIAESPTAPAADSVDIEALAIRAEAILAFIREHHIDPPSDGEMWLAGTLTLKRATLRQQEPVLTPIPNDAATSLNTAEKRRDFLAATWTREIAPNIPPRTNSGYSLLRIFAQGMLPEGADLVPGNEYKIEERVRSNRYSGTGISLKTDDSTGYPQIAGAFPDGPMARAGGQANDLIVKVDGRDTQGWTISQIRDVLSGDEGTTVSVDLKFGVNAAARTVAVTRGTILLPTLRGMADGIGKYQVLPNSSIRYIALRNINGSTVHDLRRLETTFRSERARAVILDLRNTHGHDLHVALLLADALMDGGTIGRLRTRTRVQEYHADRECLFRDMPLAILVDRETEGIGEWIAAALQDNGAAVIVGGRTAGSIVVQTFVPLPETNEYLHLPTGRFERPKLQIGQIPSNGDRSDAGAVIPDLAAESSTPEFARIRRGTSAIARPETTKPEESQDVKPDAALAAAIQELTRRIEAASSETRRN
jgi:carboxyl-terminal processing protease